MLKLVTAAAAVLVLVLPTTALAGMTRTEAALLRTMNRVRAAHGLGRLRYDAHLERAARSHSHTMLATDVFRHGAFGSRMLRFDVTGTLAGDTVTGTATTQILMKDFGFDPPSVAGILTVQDGVTVTVNFTAVKAA